MIAYCCPFLSVTSKGLLFRCWRSHAIGSGVGAAEGVGVASAKGVELGVGVALGIGTGVGASTGVGDGVGEAVAPLPLIDAMMVSAIDEILSQVFCGDSLLRIMRNAKPPKIRVISSRREYFRTCTQGEEVIYNFTQRIASFLEFM